MMNGFLKPALRCRPFIQDVQIANSDGLFKADTRQRSRMAVQAYAREGDNVQSAYTAPGASKGLEYFEGDHSPEEMAKEAARIARRTASRQTGAQRCDAGHY